LNSQANQTSAKITLWYSQIVSTGGLEPPCPLRRQPLKLVRLPFRHVDVDPPKRALDVTAPQHARPTISAENYPCALPVK
jgi:hypothetical protein